MFSPVPFAVPLAQAGKLRMLGVTTSERVEVIADVPPLTEIGLKDLSATSWFMLVAPSGAPPAVIDKLHAEVRGIIAYPEVRKEFIRLGLLPVQSPPPGELKSFMQGEIARWGALVRQAGLEKSQ